MMFFSFPESEDLPRKRRPRRSREVCKPDEVLSWHRLEKQYQSGEIIKVLITGSYLCPSPSLSPEAQEGGILVEACGLSGFIPSSHKLPKIHKAGEETTVKILELSKEQRRLVFSEREARLDVLLSTLKPGERCQGKVINLTDFGAFVDLEGVVGLVHISELADQFVKHPSEVVSIGERVEVKILSLDQAKRRINLSLKQAASPTASESLKTPDLFDVFSPEIGELSKSSLAAFQSRAIISPSKILLGHDIDTNEEISLGDVARCGGWYILGQPRTGKSNLLVSCALQDAEHGHGLLFIDPHGDAITDFLKRVPRKRIKDVILLEPTDPKYSFSLNVLPHVGLTSMQELDDLHAQIMNIFMKVWEKSWGVWLEKVLRNTLYLLLENPGYTLVEIPLLLTNKAFREALISKVKLNPYVVDFWHDEFDRLSARDKQEQIQPVLTRLDLFRTNSYVRQVVGSACHPLDFTSLWNTQKIVLLKLSMNLSNDVRTLFGTLIIHQLLQAAFARDSIPEERRSFFALYCDEFQNFSTPDFAWLFTQMGKYKLMPTVAHQERLGQFKPDDPNQGATLAAASKTCFRLSVADAPELAPEFAKQGPVMEVIGQRKIKTISSNPFEDLIRNGYSNSTVQMYTDDFLKPLVQELELLGSGDEDILEKNGCKTGRRHLLLGKQLIDNLLLEAGKKRIAPETKEEAEKIAEIIVELRGYLGIYDAVEQVYTFNPQRGGFYTRLRPTDKVLTDAHMPDELIELIYAYVEALSTQLDFVQFGGKNQA